MILKGKVYQYLHANARVIEFLYSGYRSNKINQIEKENLLAVLQNLAVEIYNERRRYGDLRYRNIHNTVQ